jgi:hypothetical protein
MTNFKVSSYVCAIFIFPLAFNLLVGHYTVLIYRCLKQGCRFFVPPRSKYFLIMEIQAFIPKYQYSQPKKVYNRQRNQNWLNLNKFFTFALVTILSTVQ